MSGTSGFPLPVVDGLTLPDPLRAALRPDEWVQDDGGNFRRLPRFFYEIGSREAARETRLAPNFSLYEFIYTDLHEAAILHGFPRYIPCAVTLIAAQLALLRDRVNTYVHIAANGGYRSPGHRHSRSATPHQWGSAANIYRIGDDFLDRRETIERYADIARQVAPSIWVRPYGTDVGEADDHLHLDAGFVTVVPREAAGEDPG